MAGWEKFAVRLGMIGCRPGERFTFVQWLSARPFDRLPALEEARRLEVAFTAGLRGGRESVPPRGPVPGGARGGETG